MKERPTTYTITVASDGVPTVLVAARQAATLI